MKKRGLKYYEKAKDELSFFIAMIVIFTAIGLFASVLASIDKASGKLGVALFLVILYIVTRKKETT